MLSLSPSAIFVSHFLAYLALENECPLIFNFAKEYNGGFAMSITPSN